MSKQGIQNDSIVNNLRALIINNESISPDEVELMKVKLKSYLFIYRSLSL